MFQKYPSAIRKALDYNYQKIKAQLYDSALDKLNNPSAAKKNGGLVALGSAEHETVCRQMIAKDQTMKQFQLISQEANHCLAELILQQAYDKARAEHSKLLYMLKTGSFANKQEKNQLAKKLAYYLAEVNLYRGALRSLY
jgi:hypothetical protein